MFGGMGTLCILCPDSNSTTAVCIFLWNNTEAIAAVAVFLFIYRDPKHLLSQTPKFKKVFFEKTKKGGFRRVNSSREKLSQNRPETAFHRSDSVHKVDAG